MSAAPVPDRFGRGLAAAVLLALVLAVYWPVGHFPFVSFDDGQYVVENIHVREGLTWGGVTWAVRAMSASNWHPLTWLSHMTDVELFGMDAGWHHRVNLILHGINALLLFLALHGMTGALWRSGFVAALFAVHPLHVESVAWVAERKDVLSTLFAFGAILTYSRYTVRRDWRLYLLTAFLFTAGLLAKPMLVTLPFVLLLLDFWPLRRISAASGAEAGGGIPLLRIIAEKVPLLLLSAGSCVTTLIAQNAGGTGAVMPVALFPLGTRLANALASCAGYLGKTIWPASLAVFYPHPATFHGSIGSGKVAAGAMLVAGISALAIAWRRRRPYLATGWFWYLGTLIPVIGFVQVGFQAMADRYTYVPIVGVFIATTWGVHGALEGWRFRDLFLGVAGALVVLALAVTCRVQVSYWRSDVSLFGHAVSVTSNNWLAHNNLGNALCREGLTEESVEHFRAALRIVPGYPEAGYNLANSLEKLGRVDEAVELYRDVLRNKPSDPDVRNNLGICLVRRGEFGEAILQFREAVRLRPGFDAARRNLEVVLGRKSGRDTR